VLYLEKEINMKKVISTENAPEAIGPYSQAILSNDTLYLSGQIAINPNTGSLIIDNISNETTQVMENIGAVLANADMNFNNIVKCSIFMKNMKDYSKINKVYSQYFDKNAPAREAVQVSVLPNNVNIEISVIAVK
jgi:2-iminobutanoate/2-iminopropanoate deaminase